MHAALAAGILRTRTAVEIEVEDNGELRHVRFEVYRQGDNDGTNEHAFRVKTGDTDGRAMHMNPQVCHPQDPGSPPRMRIWRRGY